MDVYRIGYCVTAHGYGHAARSAAVMEALSGLVDVHFKIITGIPACFFRNSLTASFSVHPMQVDVGLVQRSALEIDLPATVDALRNFYPVEKKFLHKLSSILADCQLAIGDVAPVAFAAARDAGVPSVLVENFTWDWIYEDYLASCPELGRIIAHIKELYRLAEHRIQAEPVCTAIRRDLLAAPIARKMRNEREAIRRRLKVKQGQKLVLISMGGEGIRQLPVHALVKHPDIVFLVPGLKSSVAGQQNIRIISEDSGFFHPDLIAASDAVVGKVGYSTLAEVYHAGVPFGYIQRPDFRESESLVQFIKRRMSGIEIASEDYISGDWTALLPRLFALKKERTVQVNGADQCAGFAASLLRSFPRTPCHQIIRFKTPLF